MRLIMFITSLIGVFVSATAGTLTKEISFSSSTFGTVVEGMFSSLKTAMKWPGMDTYVTSDNVLIPYKVITVEVPLLSKSFEIDEFIVHYSDTINYSYPLYQEESESQSELFGKRVESSILKNLESNQIEVVDEYILGSIHYIKIALSPVKYNQQKKEIYVCDEIDFTISYEECMEENLEYNIYHTYDGIKRNIVQNSTLKHYVIITSDAFKSICEDMALWKKEQGYDSRIITVKEILSNPDFEIGERTGIIDAAEAVRKYLMSIYSSDEMYCVFVGDTNNDMPFRYFYNSSTREGKYGNIHGDNFIPSDLYFSDLSKKWILNEEDNGIHTISVSQIAYSPNIYVGRIICSTEEELRNYFNKLLIYESFPGRGNDEYLDTALVFQQTQHLNYPNLVEEIGGFQTILKFQDNKNYTFDYSYPTGEDIILGLRRCGLSSWQGHGNPGSVACAGKNEDGNNWRYIKSRDEYPGTSMWLPEKEKNNGLDLMDNEKYPSVVYSLSCDIAPFDDCYDMHLKYNMGTSFTVGGAYGGVALLGNSRTGWDAANKKFELWFAKNIVASPIGYAHAYAKKNSNVTDKYALAAHNIIGDPTLYIWLGKPKRLHPAYSQIGNTFNIYDKDLDGSSVVIYNGDNTMAYKPETANLNINTLSNNLQLISIFKRNYLPELVLFGQNFKLKDCSKKFICKNAYIGKDIMEGKPEGCAIISENGNLNIRSIDSVSLGEGLVIESNGNVQVSCDGSIELKGVSVKDNGILNLYGQTVVLKDGTTIESGALMRINVK